MRNEGIGIFLILFGFLLALGAVGTSDLDTITALMLGETADTTPFWKLALVSVVGLGSAGLGGWLMEGGG